MILTKALERFFDNMHSIDRSPHTISVYKRDLTFFSHYLAKQFNGPVYLEDITVNDIESYLQMLKDVKKVAPNSRSRNFYTIRAFYNFAYKKELVDRNIALSLDFIKLPKKERQYLTEEEVTQLVDVIKKPLIRLVVTFLFHTGLRISECLKLTLDDVDLENKVIKVIDGKGAKDRTIPINDFLSPLLLDYRENWRDAYGSDKFFATKKSGALSNVYVNHSIGAAVKELGWKKKVSCHILRHSFASNLVRKNVGLVQIQKLLGHSSLDVTSIYTHTDLDQLFDAVNAM